MNNTSLPSSPIPSNGTAPSDVFLFPEYAKIILYVVQCALVLFGMAGNILVILSVFYNTNMKKSISNLFIANLAVSDIFVLAVSHSFILGLEIHEHRWPFGRFACEGLYPFSDSFFGVSIWSIVVISYHRYGGIVHTMRSRMSRKKARLFLAATWVFSITVVTVPLWVFMTLIGSNGIYYCDSGFPNTESNIAYLITVTVLFYALPLVLIIYCYIRIRFSLQKSTGFHREMTKSSSRNTLREDVSKRIRGNAKALRVLTPVVVVFFLTMLPINMFRILAIFPWFTRFPYTQALFYVCIVLLCANSSVNPLIYSIVSPEFRRSFARFLGLRRVTRAFSQNTEPYMTNGYSQDNLAAQNMTKNGNDPV